AVLHGCSSPPPPAAVPRPVLVEHPQPLASQVGEVFPGSVRAREESDLSFRVAGKILTRRVQAGETVKPGDVLATLDPQDARLNLQSAEAAQTATEADVRLAAADIKRHKDMLDKGFISKSLYDTKVNALDVVQARLDQARANVAVARNQSSYTTLTADKTGLITAVVAEAGQVVAVGQPVFKFASDSAREVVIAVPEGRIEALQKAPQLAISLWARPGKFYSGHLREVNLEADRSTRTHEARVTILDPDAAVQLGMSANVLVGEELHGSLFQLPLSALGGSKEQPAVWIVGEDGKAHEVPVTVLRYLETGAVVTGALDAKMNMVSAGTHLMTEGLAVSVIQRERHGS
ncbi:MAG: efflux RND transporter periplasmic adaptor subunit, partial [Stenotrophobium sp.]